MMKKNEYSRFLIVAYVLVFILFIVISWHSLFRAGELFNLLINLALFVIVFLIFINAFKRFLGVEHIRRDLLDASDSLSEDNGIEADSFFSKYRDNNEKLFNDPTLNERLRDYFAEEARLSQISEKNYYCDIEDYINREIVDEEIHKSAFSLVPGVLTGLGILGTFAGLTLGLRSFNTGTAAEIAESIAPLMDGIKVAFHTSLFGMIFSLVFNYLFRRELDTSYSAVDRFLDVFSKRVVSDAENSNRGYAQAALVELPQRMAEAMAPQFDKLNLSLNAFADIVSDQQLTGIEDLIDSFVHEMNKSLNGSFQNLGNVINNTCELQKRQNEMMEDILNSIYERSSDIDKIHQESERIISSMSSFIGEVEELQLVFTENLTKMYDQIDAIQKYVEATKSIVDDFAQHHAKVSDQSLQVLHGMENSIGTIKTVLGDNTAAIESISSKTIEEMRNAADTLSKTSNELTKDLSKAMEDTFKQFDELLSDVSRHLSGTISEIETVTGKTPKVLDAAYKNMQKEFESAQQRLEILVSGVSDLIDKLPKKSLLVR